MTLLGLRNDGGGYRLLCWRRARLLCSLVLCDCPFDGALCLVCELCRLAVVCVDCRYSMCFVFLGGARRLELSV